MDTEFGLFAASDPTDRRFTCDICWSRIYEYPYVMRQIDGPLVHNTSWGYAGIHLVFKTWLDVHCTATHTDVRDSSLYGTALWDLTTNPREEWLNHFDAVLCISTLEEVRSNHVTILRDHLLPQVKPGGRLIVTFDLPGFQIDEVADWLGQPPKVPPDPLTPRTSVEPDVRLGLGDDYRVGFLTIRR